MQNRIIFHCDCNNFYASVELLSYPELKDKPVAVSGSVDDRHGIILAKNEAAKKYEIQTAETVWQAKRKCPELILLPPHHSKYKKYSDLINEIYSNYTDCVEPFGIDESWLDLTGSWNLFGNSPLEVADKLRNEVSRQTGLTISVGVSFNKTFAKLASDLKKPNATTEISRENYKEIAWKQPAAALLYVGRKAAQTLNELEIRTIGQLAKADKTLLVQVFGKAGEQMHRYACGQDDSPVSKTGESEQVKSVGNGRTFSRDLKGHQDIRRAIGMLADEVAGRLREENLYATNVQVTIKNPELKSISRQKAMPFATNLAKDLTTAAMELILQNWNLAKPVRMLTVTAGRLTDTPFAVQTSLFGGDQNIDKKQQKLEKSIDKIREKYGKSAILQAGILHNDMGFAKKASIFKDGEDEDEDES